MQFLLTSVYSDLSREHVSTWSSTVGYFDESFFFNDSQTDHDILMEINRREAMFLLPVIVYTVVLMLVGLAGNSLSIYIYGWKWKNSATRIFLLSLAMSDIITCSIIMPTEIYILINTVDCRSEAICLISRFGPYATGNTSAIVLVSIAIDRYNRICHPYKMHINVYKSKIICLLSFCFGFTVSLPAFKLFGTRNVTLPTVNTRTGSIRGVICDYNRNLTNRTYILFLEIYLWCGFIISCFILSVLYALIGLVMFKSSRKRSIATEIPISVVPNPTGCSNVGEICTSDIGVVGMSKVRAVDAPEAGNDRISSNVDKVSSGGFYTTTSDGVTFEPSAEQQKQHISIGIHSRIGRETHVRAIRSAVLPFVLTAVYVLSVLPVTIILTFYYVSLLSKSSIGSIMVNILSRSYFVNSSINPVIYGLCNSQFRKKVKECLCHS